MNKNILKQFDEAIKVGDKFNKLTAIKFIKIGKNSQQYWLFKCDCGNEKVIRVNNVKANETKSCGCLVKTHGMTKTKTYISWEKMKQRCLNLNHPNYKYYGNRGITICEEWLKFKNFYQDMGTRPEEKSIDRINNNKGYYKENCCWSTMKEQANNRRSNHLITYKGKIQNITQWAKELNMKSFTIQNRIRRGWSIEKALFL